MPEAGQNRITGMIESRPDWVISRQRAWGVPIAVFIKEKPDGSVEILQDPEVEVRIVEAFEAEGADAWYKPGARERFLGKLANDTWKKVDDILDVWFDSGSTHAFVLEDPVHFPTLAGIKRKVDGGQDTVMYLEGSDQHRGWFHSSLLECCGTRGRAPFDVVLTHGFVLDEQGRKMSKSTGNVTAPQDVIKQSGADILRMWVCASDYADDLRIGPEILKTTVDTYRKLRNTVRWMLGNLAHFHEDERVKFEQMPELERLMLHRLSELDALVRKAYADFDYKRIFAALSAFMTSDLSAFYFDIRKDALYCDPYSSTTRKACLTVLDHLFRCTVVWLAPMLCFTAEESWASRYGADAKSVHLELFPEVPAAWRDDKLADKWRKVRTVRRVVTGALEIERAQKRIGSSLEAHPIVLVTDEDLYEAVLDVDLAEVCITSALTLSNVAPSGDAFRLPDVPGVAVIPNLAEGTKCARSWKILTTIGADPEYPGGLAARRQGAARMGNHAQGGGVNAQLSYGPAHPFRPCRGGDRLPARSGDEALSAQRGRSRQPPAAARAVLRFRAHPQYRHQLRPVPDRRPARPMGAARLQGAGGAAALAVAGALQGSADGAVARPDHRRGGGQRHRPAGLWLGRRFRVFPRIHGNLAVQLVRL